jgi:hypothetical protein
MLARLIACLFLLVFFLSTYGQASLIGTWRHVAPQHKALDIASKHLKVGDLIIRSDSTFHIEGDSSTRNSTIPGWHVGDEYNGTWEQKNNLLFLLLENQPFLSFIIVKLTSERLVLRLGFDKKDKKHDFTYLRL